MSDYFLGLILSIVNSLQGGYASVLGFCVFLLMMGYDLTAKYRPVCLVPCDSSAISIHKAFDPDYL
jgi:hypothetical protein